MLRNVLSEQTIGVLISFPLSTSNVLFAVTPRTKVKQVAKMLKAVHAQKSKKTAREKAKAMLEGFRSMKLKKAKQKVKDGIDETLTHCDFPNKCLPLIRINNVIKQLKRKICCRTRMVSSLPDGNSVFMLFCAWLRHLSGSQRGKKKYINMKHLDAALGETSIAGRLHSSRFCKPKREKSLTLALHHFLI